MVMRATVGLAIAALASSNAVLRREQTARALVEVKAPPIGNDTMKKAREASVNFQNFLTSLRGAGGSTYYDDLFKAIQIELCQYNVDKDGHNAQTGEANMAYTGADSDILPYFRFVQPSSKFADKDSNDQCRRVSNPSSNVRTMYNNGYCEVRPNCYWTKLDPTSAVDRLPVYSLNQGTPPATGAMTLDDANTKLTTWIKGFGACVIPSIVLLVLSLLTILLFIICRCCCNKCGGRNGKPGGYSCREKSLPVLFYLLFSIGILSLAGLSYLYSTVITQSVSNIFTIALGLIVTIVDWIASIVSPLNHIGATVQSTATNVGHQLDNSGFIENGLNGIVFRLGDFAANTADVKLPRGCKVGVDRFCTPCGACTTISQQISTAQTQMTTVASTGISSLASARSGIMDLLVSAATEIANLVNSVGDYNEQLQLTIADKKRLITDIQSIWDSNGTLTQGAFLALFALAIVTIALGLLGVFFGLTPLRVLVIIMHLAYIVGFIAIIVTFILSIVFIAFSLLLGDLCKLQVIAASDWTQVFGKDAAAINSCFRANESLIEVFNLTSSFAFATDITFPSLDLSSTLNFSSFDTFVSGIQGVTTSTFNMDPSVTLAFLAALNSNSSTNVNTCHATGGNYDLTNIFTPWTANNDPMVNGVSPKDYMTAKYQPGVVGVCPDAPASVCTNSNGQPCTFDEFIVDLWLNVTTLQTISLQATQFINDMQTNITNLDNYVDNFKTNVTDLTTTLDGIATTLKNTLIKDVDTIEAQMYCTFVATTYFSLTEQLCSYMTPSFLMIALFLFIMGVFLIPINITLIIMVKRLRHRGGGSTHVENNLK
ncbi:hypothetical protein ACHHYP_07238 [Achlya hypogyna]|uniref:Transmembrane protein n=1 Tax=Achlya hypogyna TaxID=1202772 RepID=A0A1V9ZN04_ACHHY|nr:hypothetical protein ACHHYP_07238 [Achlya hypogyna]